MAKRQNFKKLQFVLLTLFLLVITIISGLGDLPAFAETLDYTSALEDLRKDSSFKVSDYPDKVPVKKEDYTIDVIQIAESTDGELFIYTYQPCQKSLYLIANEINMSLSDKVGVVVDEELSEADKPKLYGLTFINTSGVFVKYKVNGFKVSSAATRYYNITSIYRDYNRIADNSSLSSEKGIAIKVGKCWTARTVNGNVSYLMNTVETIMITGCKYGSLRVPSGFNFNTSYACDMHIIAFNTDIEIDDLLEADVSFDYRTVDKGIYGTDYGKWQPEEVTVTYKEKGTTSDHIFGDGVRTWDRIQTSSEFLNTCSKFEFKMTDDIKNGIKENAWVLAFWETDFQNDTGGVFGWLTWIGAVFGPSYNHYIQVSNATVLRLQFIKDGITYNLGCVSNRSGDFSVIGGGDKTFLDTVKEAIKDFFKDFFSELSWWAWLIIGIIALSIVLSVLSIIFPVVRVALKTVFFAIGNVFKAIWWVVCLPFRGLKALFDKLRGD